MKLETVALGGWGPGFICNLYGCGFGGLAKARMVTTKKLKLSFTLAIGEPCQIVVLTFFRG